MDESRTADAAKWFVEITLAAGAATCLQLDVYAEEWDIQLGGLARVGHAGLAARVPDLAVPE